MISISANFLRHLTRALLVVAFSAAAPQQLARSTHVAIDDLPGWSAWKRVAGTDKIEFRFRLFNARVKPGCGVQFRAKSPQSGYTVDAMIAHDAADLNDPLGDNNDSSATTVNGAFVGQFRDGVIPLHFSLFPNGGKIGYYDLHWEDCGTMRVFVRNIETYRSGN